MKVDVTFIIPAYNEELNLPLAINNLISEIENVVASYEILIINDGSSDFTGKVAEDIAKKNKKIKVIHHSSNLGFGQTIRDGIKLANKKYIIGFPGDNDTSAVSIRDLLKHAGEADLIISYTVNSHNRSLLRRFFSKIFIFLMNIVLRMKLKYYNGSFLCKTYDIRKLKLISPGFTVYAEAKVYLIKKGATYIEVPFVHIGRKYGKSKATNVKSIIETIQVIWYLSKKYATS